MKRVLGYGASTCSYRDWIGTDLIVFFGSNTPSNQPVTMKYLYYARQAGTKVAVVNPYFEPGLQRYWVPSITESALFGTKFADEWFAIDTGGDLAFLNGVFKVLVAEGWVDHDFISRHTAGFEEVKATLERQDWDFLERESGATRQQMGRFAEMLRDACLRTSRGTDGLAVSGKREPGTEENIGEPVLLICMAYSITSHNGSGK
jgi:anaerobic selenocysteine-containing dehydrogenase